jgi:hypothetical protein
MGSAEKVQKLLERAKHPATPGPEAEACREKAEKLRAELAEMDRGEMGVLAAKLHREIQAAGETMSEKAWMAGEVLLCVKEACEHGEWLPWLEANFPGSKRTAQVYMQIANAQRAAHMTPLGALARQIECLTSDDDFPLSIRAALNLLSMNPEPFESKGGKRTRGKRTPRQKFVKRFNCFSDDISVISYTVEKDAEFAAAAREYLDGLVEQRDLMTKLIRKLR